MNYERKNRKAGLKMELEVRSCIVWNLIRKEHLSVKFGEKIDCSNFFSNQDDNYLLVELEIGEKGQKGASIFSIQIISVDAMKKHHIQVHKHNKNSTRFIVIYDCIWETIEAKLLDFIHASNNSTYDSSVIELCKYFNWEYEGMK